MRESRYYIHCRANRSGRFAKTSSRKWAAAVVVNGDNVDDDDGVALRGAAERSAESTGNPDEQGRPAQRNTEWMTDAVKRQARPGPC